MNNLQSVHELWLSSHVEKYISLVVELCRELVTHIDYEKDQKVNNRPETKSKNITVSTVVDTLGSHFQPHLFCWGTEFCP